MYTIYIMYNVHINFKYLVYIDKYEYISQLENWSCVTGFKTGPQYHFILNFTRPIALNRKRNRFGKGEKGKFSYQFFSFLLDYNAFFLTRYVYYTKGQAQYWMYVLCMIFIYVSI